MATVKKVYSCDRCGGTDGWRVESVSQGAPVNADAKFAQI